MKLPFFIALSSVVITSCGGKRLTEAECRVMVDREIQQGIVGEVPPEEAEAFKSILAEAAHDRLAQCMSGEAYERGDYECVTKAVGESEVARCFIEMSKRNGPGVKVLIGPVEPPASGSG